MSDFPEVDPTSFRDRLDNVVPVDDGTLGVGDVARIVSVGPLRVERIVPGATGDALVWDGSQWVADNSTYIASNDVEDGVALFSGDGTTTTFTVSHSLGTAPSLVLVQFTSIDARDSGPAQVTNETSTSFDVVFSVAPPSGTDNIEFYYQARL